MQAIMRSRRRLFTAIGLLFALALYMDGGDTAQAVETSPDGRSRIEYRSLTRWQSLTTLYADDMWYARLHLPSGKVIDSAPYYMNGSGPTLWLEDGGIVIGVTAQFDPGTQRWSVYP